MKKLLYVLATGVLIACGGAETTDEPDTAPAETSSASTPDEAVQEEALLPDPCTLDPQDVVAALGWTGSTDPIPAVTRQDKMRGCDYVGNSTEGRLSVVYERFSERAAQDGYLSGYYDMLIQSQSGMTYEAIDGGPGDQCLFGHGRQGPNHVYELKWREGERTDMRLTVTGSQERDANATREQLKTLAGKL